MKWADRLADYYAKQRLILMKMIISFVQPNLNPIKIKRTICPTLAYLGMLDKYKD